MENTSSICAHCGSDNGKNPIVYQHLSFCCEGCKQVYQLLHTNKLYGYYDIAQTPGIKTDTTTYATEFDYLDNPEVAAKMYDFFDSHLAKITLYMPSIHCASCIWLLENLHKLNQGIKASTVNFIQKKVSITFNTEQISLKEVIILLHTIHYIPSLTLDNLENSTKKPSNKSLLYKLGVAGFVFGNVMLYSLPEYFNGKPLDGKLSLFLSYLNYMLTVPLVFYSGSDYLISAYKHMRKGIINIDLPIALGILALFFVTSYEVIAQQGPGYADSLAGFLFFLLIGKWYQSKTYEALSFERDYTSYFPIAVTKIIENKEVNCLLKDIQVDDILCIRNKELIPTDAILLEGNGYIDYSFVTGESTPIVKEIGDTLYAGGRQTNGKITLQVTKKVEQSHLTQLWNEQEQLPSTTKSLKPLIEVVGKRFTMAVMLIAASAFTYWLVTDTLEKAILIFASVLIVACPCALALSMPFTFGNAMRFLGQKGFYVKNTTIIEKLAHIDTIVFDKTGTITLPDTNQLHYIGEPLSLKEKQGIKSLVSQSTHPYSQAINTFLTDIQTIPTTHFVEVAGKGIYALVDEIPLKMGSEFYVCGKNEQQLPNTVFLTINNQYKGYFIIKNTYRAGIETMIAALKPSYHLYLLSGDNHSEEEFLKTLFPPSHLFFNQQPLDKKECITRLQANNHRVLMTGDGLNDAGAFLASDVALSVADDIYHFSPASDTIIEAKQLHLLHRFIRYAKQSLSIVKWSFLISLLYNLTGLFFAVTGNLTPVVAAIIMPISSVTVVGFVTLMTGIAAKQITPYK